MMISGPATRTEASCVSCSMPWGTSPTRLAIQLPAPTERSAASARLCIEVPSRRPEGSIGQKAARRTMPGTLL